MNRSCRNNSLTLSSMVFESVESVKGYGLLCHDAFASTLSINPPLYRGCWKRESVAGTVEKIVSKRDLDFAQPIPWTCPQCGSAYVTPELLPRCAACGYPEDGT